MNKEVQCGRIFIEFFKDFKIATLKHMKLSKIFAKMPKISTIHMVLTAFVVISVIIKMPDMDISEWITLLQGIVIGLNLGLVLMKIGKWKQYR